MSYAISVPTPFNDISELAENFASRVDDERLMLPHGDVVPEGEWVQFAVTLADGSAALSGLGRCTGSYDNGEEREPEHRFDVVMDSLQFEEMAQIYFERILQVRAAQMGEEPQTGEVDLPDEPIDAEAEAQEMAYAGSDEVIPVAAAEADVAMDVAMEVPVAAPEDEFGGEATQAVSFDELSEAEGAAALADDGLDAMMAEPLAEPEEALAEAVPVDDAVAADAADYADAGEYAEAAPAAAADWEEGDATQFGDMPEDVSDIAEDVAPDADYQPAPAQAAPTLTAPEESNIYDLPPPSAPGQLPSPHANGATLSRRMLQATWSPEPALRPDPSPSSGYFQYAAGGGLPQPPAPPRPALHPTLRVAPAPRPGDAHAAPEAFAEAAPGASTGPTAYDDEAGYQAEAFDADGAAALGVDEALAVDDAGEAEGYAAEGYAGEEEASFEGDFEVDADANVYEAETVEGEGLDVDEGAFEDLTAGEGFDEQGHEAPPVEAATREVDLGELPDHALSHDDETAQVELPEDQQ